MARRAFHIELHAPRLRGLISHALAQLIERVRTPLQRALPPPLRGEVQRSGGVAWQMIAARWPGLAELLRERKSQRARARREQKRSARSAQLTEQPLPKPETIDALIAQLMAATPWQARAGAALSLAHHRGEGVVEALVRALHDASVEVAVAAVDALVYHPDARATEGLLCVLGNQDGYFSPVTRVAAVSALAQRLQAQELGPIFAAVRDIDAEVSIAAAAVVTERLPQLASAQLLPVLRDESGYYLPIVRLAIANALERAGLLHAGVVHELLPMERDAAVRRVLERASHLTGEISACK